MIIAQDNCQNAIPLNFSQIYQTSDDFWIEVDNSVQLKKIISLSYNQANFDKALVYSSCGILLDSANIQNNGAFGIFEFQQYYSNIKLKMVNSVQQHISFQLRVEDFHEVYVSNADGGINNDARYCIDETVFFSFTFFDPLSYASSAPSTGSTRRIRWFITGPNGTVQVANNGFSSSYPLGYNFPVAGTYSINFGEDVYLSSTQTWIIAQIPVYIPTTVIIAPSYPSFNLSATNNQPCFGEPVNILSNYIPQGNAPSSKICWTYNSNPPPNNWPSNACDLLYDNIPLNLTNLFFTDPVPYIINVTFENGCTVNKTITINPVEPFAVIQSIKLCNYKIEYTANFINCGVINYDYLWSFPGGNPSSSTLINPVVTYPGPGNYTASLTITSPLSGMQHGPYTANNISPSLSVGNIQPPLLEINGVNTNDFPLECDANNNIFSITNTANYPGYTFVISANSVTNGTYLGGGGTAAAIQWDTDPLTQSSFSVNATSPDGCVTTQTIILYPCCSSMQTSNFINGGSISTWLAANNITNNTINMGNNNLFINGTVLIDQHVTFLGCQNVLMGVNAKLDVQNFITLEIRNSNLRACGNELWDGIYADNNSKNIISINSDFSDAKCAIYLSDDAQFNITKSNFYNNWVGIGFVQMSAQNSTITQCLFKNTQLMKRAVGTVNLFATIPYQSHFSPLHKGTGIFLLSTPDFVIGDGQALNLRNEFNDLNYGIYASRSGLRAYNNKFINMNVNLITGSFPVLAFYFGTGIYIRTAINNPQQMYIGDNNPYHSNEFTNCSVGINAIESIKGELINNNFNNISLSGIWWVLNRKSKNTISNNIFSAQAGVGINLNNNPGAQFDVFENKITCIQPSNGFSRTIGIGIDATLGNAIDQNYNVARNEVNNAVYGIMVVNTLNSKINENKISSFPATLIPSNVTNYEITGIQALACSRPQIVNNLVLGNDATNFRVKGIEIQECNRPYLRCDSVQTCGWAYAIRGANSNALISGCSAANSLFGYVYYNGGFTGNQGDANNVLGNKWWNIGAGHTLATTLAGGNPTDGSLSRWFLPGFNTNTSENPNPMMVNISDFGNTLIPNIQNTSYTHPFGACAEIDYPVYRILQEKDWMKKVIQDTSFTNHLESNSRYYMEQQTFDALKNDPSYLEDEPILTAYFDEQSAGNSGKFETIADSINSKGSLSETEKAELELLRASIVPEREQEQNLKTVTEIYLKTFAIGIDSLSTTSINILHSIAQTCYFQGGKAVLVARSMLNSLPNSLPSYYADSCIAAYGMQRQSKPQASNVSAVKVYPSVLDKGDALTIENATGYNLQLINLMGNILLEQRIKQTTEQITVPYQAATGLYFVKLINPLGKVSTQKIIIH